MTLEQLNNLTDEHKLDDYLAELLEDEQHDIDMDMLPLNFEEAL